MKLSDLDDPTRLLIFRATLLAKHPERPTGLADLQEAVRLFEEVHGDEMLANLLACVFDESVPDAEDDGMEKCESCCGLGLMDGSTICPKCHGDGEVPKAEWMDRLIEYWRPMFEDWQDFQ